MATTYHGSYGIARLFSRLFRVDGLLFGAPSNDWRLLRPQAGLQKSCGASTGNVEVITSMRRDEPNMLLLYRRNGSRQQSDPQASPLQRFLMQPYPRENLLPSTPAFLLNSAPRSVAHRRQFTGSVFNGVSMRVRAVGDNLSILFGQHLWSEFLDPFGRDVQSSGVWASR